MRLLGLSAARGGGKDTLCNHFIANENEIGLMCSRIAFADPLKDIVAAMFGEHEDKEAPLPCGKSTRELCRLIGKTMIDADPFVFVRKAMTMADLYKKYGTQMSIVTDVRYPLELAAIRERGGKIIRLTRGMTSDPHASERALDGQSFDAIIDNMDLTSSQTFLRAVGLLKEWQWI